jgi:hypothetical protein
MFKIPDEYADNLDFQEFLNREFNSTAANATMEELSEFAFSSIEAAIKAFEQFAEN